MPPQLYTLRAALVVVGLLLSVSRIDAQRTEIAADSSAHGDRSPGTAAVLGTVVPGAGHIYAGEYVRGAQLYLTAVSGIGGGYLIYVLDRCAFTWDPCNSGP